MDIEEIQEECTFEGLKNVERINQRIDAFIRTKPEVWAKVQALPRERLERSYALKIMARLRERQKQRELEAKAWLEQQPVEVRAEIMDKANRLSTVSAQKKAYELAARKMKTEGVS